MKKLIRVTASALMLSLAFGSISHAAAGWSQQNGRWYYTERSGAAAAGEMKVINSQKYSFNGKGEMIHDEWYYNQGDDKWYYMGSDGAAVKGWLQLGTEWYYLLGSGAMMADGWRTIDGSRYYFKENGVMKQNGYAGEKYLDSSGVNDSRYDIKVRGKTDKEILEEAGNAAENIPGWLLANIIESGWKIACNAEKENYGRDTHEDYNDYTRYCELETSRKLIFFIEPEYILQGIGLYVNNTFGNPGSSIDFQGAFSSDWDHVNDMFPQYPIIEKNPRMAFAEVFALYYNEEIGDTGSYIRHKIEVKTTIRWQE